MDLAKLTLGAFIGSFVQRNASNQAVAESGPKQNLAAPATLAKETGAASQAQAASDDARKNAKEDAANKF